MIRQSDILQNILDVEIRASKIHGLGLFSSIERPLGAILCHLDGQVIDASMSEFVIWEHEWNGIGGEYVLARGIQTLYSFINHSKNPNLCIHPKTFILYAAMYVEKDSELTLNYLENGVPSVYNLKSADWL